MIVALSARISTARQAEIVVHSLFRFFRDSLNALRGVPQHS
jgi:hypothetical protein